MSTMRRNLQLLWRAERSLLGSQLNLTMRKVVLVIVTAIIAAFAIAMFDISAFFALEPSMGKAGAALLVGIGNLVFAALIFALANNMAPGEEEGVMREAREIAISEIGADIDELHEQFREFRSDVDGIRTGISRVVKHPSELLTPATVASALAAVTSILKATNLKATKK